MPNAPKDDPPARFGVSGLLASEVAGLAPRPLVARFSMLFGGRLVGAVAMFVSNLLIARFYGAGSLADFALLMSGMGIITVFLVAGFDRVGSYFAAEYAAKRQPELLKGFLAAGARHVLRGLVVAIVLLAMLASIRPAGLPDISLRDGLLACAGAAGNALTYLFVSILVGLKRPLTGVLPDTLLRPALFLVSVVVLTAVAGHAGFAPVAVAYVALIWLSLTVLAVLSWKKWMEIAACKAAADYPRWRRAAYPWATISLSSDYLIDVMILIAGIIAQRQEVAILYVCFRFRMLAAFGMQAILALLIPDIVATKALGNAASLQGRLMQVNLLTFAYVIGVLLAFAIAGPWLLGLFGGEMAGGYATLLVVALALLFVAMFGPAPQILAIHNAHNGSAIVMNGGMAITVAMMLAFYPFFGIVGVAAAYAIGSFAVSLALWRYTLHRTGIDCSIFALKAGLARHKGNLLAAVRVPGARE